MIRSGYLNFRSRGFAVKLPPAKNYTKPQTKRYKPTPSKGLTEYLLMCFVVTSIFGLIIFCIVNFNVENCKVIPYKNSKENQKYMSQCTPNRKTANTSSVKNIIRIGFYKLSIKQYSAALLHFEGALIERENIKETNLGMAYALTGICKRDQQYCELSKQYIDYVKNSNQYSASQIQYLEAFLKNKPVDAYLYSLAH